MTITITNKTIRPIYPTMQKTKLVNLEELPLFARELVDDLRVQDRVALMGEMGAGKTTLVKAIAKALGYEGMVKSPTFTILNEYKLPTDNDFAGLKKIIHADFYRFENFKDIQALDLESELNNETIFFAEWPERVDKMDWEPTVVIKMIWISPTVREIGWERLD